MPLRRHVRLQKKKDFAENEGKWITIRGTSVQLDSKGSGNKDFYDPSQPRDKDGKFASSGGGGGSASSSAGGASRQGETTATTTTAGGATKREVEDLQYLSKKINELKKEIPEEKFDMLQSEYNSVWSGRPMIKGEKAKAVLATNQLLDHIGQLSGADEINNFAKEMQKSLDKLPMKVPNLKGKLFGIGVERNITDYKTEKKAKAKMEKAVKWIFSSLYNHDMKNKNKKAFGNNDWKSTLSEARDVKSDKELYDLMELK